MKEKLFNRNFTLLILGQVSSLTGNLTLKFALSMYVLERTDSASLFAGLLAASMVPTILLSPFGGILADRADRRAVMAGLDALSGLSVLLAALALPHGPDLAVIAVLLILLSVLAAFESPTVQACVPQMLSGDNVLRGNAMVNQVQALASLATPFLGSLFYTAFGIRPFLWGAVACFFLTALFECFLRLPLPPPGPKSRLAALIRQDIALTLRFLRREQPAILGLLGLAALAVQDTIPRLAADGSNAMMAVTSAHAPGVIVGLVSAASICATMSSADSNLLCMSTMVMNDLYMGLGGKRNLSEKSIIFYTRVCNVVFALIAMGISMFGVDIVTMNTFAFGIRCSGPFAAYGLGLAVPRATKTAGVFSLVAGTAGFLVWQFLSGGDFLFGILPVVFGCAVSVVAFFVVNAITLAMGQKPAPSAYIEE